MAYRVDKTNVGHGVKEGWTHGDEPAVSDDEAER